MRNTGKIRNLPLSGEVYNRLLRLILNGHFEAGSRLREEDLCKKLGVSRTPVREALIRLAREGVLEQKPRCGCIVKKTDSNDIKELMECRSMLECMILEKYFSAIDRKKAGELKVKLEKADGLSSKETRDLVLSSDEALHELVGNACSNKYLAAQLKQVVLLCRPYRVLRCSEQDISLISRERLEMLEAIIDNDLKSALTSLKEHFISSARYYSESSKNV